MSETVIVNHWVPVGSGGDGISPHVALGILSTGPVVVIATFVAMVYDQSHATMAPGAVDVLPSKVQLIVLPLSAIVQVSVCDGPVTPKLAVATVGRVTDRTADRDAPP